MQYYICLKEVLLLQSTTVTVYYTTIIRRESYTSILVVLHAKTHHMIHSILNMENTSTTVCCIQVVYILFRMYSSAPGVHILYKCVMIDLLKF